MEKTVKGGGSSERWLYTRSGDGKLISEDYWKNGVLIRRTEYETETEYVETYYLHRKPILRIIYVDGNRAGEESVPSGGEGGNGR